MSILTMKLTIEGIAANCASDEHEKWTLTRGVIDDLAYFGQDLPEVLERRVEIYEFIGHKRAADALREIIKAIK